MKLIALCAYAVALAAVSSSNAHAQFGVCDRAANNALFLVNQETNNHINSILNSDSPPEVKNAQITIYNHSRAEAVQSVYVSHQECAQGFRHPQSIVDTALQVFTLGVSRRFGRAGYVDVSEIMSGRPLGGPTAVIPQVREQVLRNNQGTIANTVRDPIRCVFGRRKC